MSMKIPDIDVTFSVKNELSASFVPSSTLRKLLLQDTAADLGLTLKVCEHTVTDIEDDIEYCVECGIDLEDMFE